MSGKIKIELEHVDMVKYAKEVKMFGDVALSNSIKRRLDRIARMQANKETYYLGQTHIEVIEARLRVCELELCQRYVNST